jgi:hypothetical protein
MQTLARLHAASPSQPRTYRRDRRNRSTGAPARIVLLDVAAEHRAPYVEPEDRPDGRPTGAGRPGMDVPDGRATVPTDGVSPADGALAAIAALVTSASRVATIDTDALTQDELEQLLDGMRRPLTQLEAARARMFADLEQRAVQRSSHHRIAGARDEQRRRNAERHRLSRSQAKRAAEAGRAATDHAATGTAFRQGDLGADHARIIGDVLSRISAERRAAVEARLLTLAANRDPVAFGRAARELLAREAPADAAKAERRQHLRRSVKMADTADGGFFFSGLLYGAAAESARTAIHAFRLPDTPGEHRSPEQRNADAFEQLCEAALRAGTAPTQHGVRPHVVVIVEEGELGRDFGTARFAQSGQPTTTSSLRHVLTDCSVSRLVRDAAGTPIEASESVRTVPAGLWRALLVRDGGCTWPGCDAPPSWCDVAHGQIPFRRGGVLSPANAALLCRRHHRRFDSTEVSLVIEGDQVTYRHRDQTDPSAPAPPASPGTLSSDPARDVNEPTPPPPRAARVDQLPLALERDPPPPDPEHPPG